MRMSSSLVLVSLVACAGASRSTPAPPPARPPPSIATSTTDRALAVQPATPLDARATAALDGAIASYFETAATRRVTIVTDKPLYQPGETVWLRVDLRATGTLLGGPPTGVTASLISPRGAAVIGKRLLVQRGVGRADLALPDGLDGGEYRLQVVADDGTTAARTLVVSTYQAPRLQKTVEFVRKAYGAGDLVQAAIAVADAHGAAFASRPLTAVATVDDVEVARLPLTTDGAGHATARFRLPAQLARGDGLLTVLADDGGVTESIQKRIPIVMATLDLGLYPEGGDLVAGVPGRVYLAARTLTGEPADVAGKVVDDRGAVVATFASLRDGLGRFELTPAADRRYHVALDKPAGITATFDVPAAAPHGCVVRAVDQRRADRLRVAALCDQPQRVKVVAVLRERWLASGGFDVPADAAAVVELPIDARATGVVRVTLLSADDRPLAERLVFHGTAAGVTVAITADRPSYGPRDPVTLTLHATDADGRPVQTSLALAVVDQTVLSFADDHQGGLAAQALLGPELGISPDAPLRDPDAYLAATPDAAAALDALLATRGYRRFEWRPILAALPGGTP